MAQEQSASAYEQAMGTLSDAIQLATEVEALAEEITGGGYGDADGSEAPARGGAMGRLHDRADSAADAIKCGRRALQRIRQTFDGYQPRSAAQPGGVGAYASPLATPFAGQRIG